MSEVDEYQVAKRYNLVHLDRIKLYVVNQHKLLIDLGQDDRRIAFLEALPHLWPNNPHQQVDAMRHKAENFYCVVASRIGVALCVLVHQHVIKAGMGWLMSSDYEPHLEYPMHVDDAFSRFFSSQVLHSVRDSSLHLFQHLGHEVYMKGGDFHMLVCSQDQLDLEGENA